MKFTTLALVLAFGVSAFAQEQQSQEAQTKMKIDETKDKNKVDGDIDAEITNAKMRAESGSKSKWSISTSLEYTGGSLTNAFGVLRPNLAAEPGVEENTSAGMGLDVRYRWTAKDSLTLGTSFGLMTPFQGDMDGNETQLNVFDPGISYNRVGKVGIFQTSGSIGASVGTSQSSQDIDRIASYGISYSLLYAFQNRPTTGISVSAGYNQYSTDARQPENPKLNDATNEEDLGLSGYGDDARTDYSLGIYPFAEYAFNDTFSARTVFGYFNWKHLYGDARANRLLQTFVYQSVGLGISVSRDVYLYPNIQFVPDDLRSDFTNVAISANINIF